MESTDDVMKVVTWSFQEYLLVCKIPILNVNLHKAYEPEVWT